MNIPSPQNWEGRGLCRSEGDPSWWDDFLDHEEDEPGEPKADRRARHDKAKAVCRRCPVQDFCAATTKLDTDDGIRFGELISDLRSRNSHRKAINFEILKYDAAS